MEKYAIILLYLLSIIAGYFIGRNVYKTGIKNLHSILIVFILLCVTIFKTNIMMIISLSFMAAMGLSVMTKSTIITRPNIELRGWALYFGALAIGIIKIIMLFMY